jgi:N-acetyl-gamma-glutamyl-phosphate reductase
MGIKIGIVGATGYVGEELVRILCRHPQVTEITVAAKDALGQRLSQVYPHLSGFADMEILDTDQVPELISSSDLVFSAMPHGLSAPVVRQTLAAGRRVIDMAADFRLPDQALYEQWYQVAHEAPDLLGEAVYGLPELFRPAVEAARLVANPGCYPTSALIALAPLMKHGLVNQNSVIVDSKSGVSGAGRTLALGSHYCECNDNVRAYAVGSHRHTPEISHYASVLAGSKVDVLFTPHLIPMTRGILSTIYAELLRPLDAASLRQVYQDFYGGEAFIQLLATGLWPETKWVQGTNRCCLGLTVVGQKRLIVVSAIDNLVKGAAGQAVQNMNLMFGIPEGCGLDYPGLYP